MRKENIQKKLSALTCQDNEHKFYGSLSQVYTNDNIMLASDGFRAGMYFPNNNSDTYSNLSVIKEDNVLNAIQTAIKTFLYDSQIDINRKIMKDVITDQVSDLKAQCKDYYNWRKDTIKNTTKLTFDIQNNTMTIISYSHVSKLTGYDTQGNIHIPKFSHKSFMSNVSYPHELNILPIFVHYNRFHNNIIPLTFTTEYLLDLINFHTDDTLQLLVYDSNSGVMPVMSIQSDRLMLLLPVRNPSESEEGE